MKTGRPKLLLRMAAVVTALLALGHTLGNPWTPEIGDGARSVIDAMARYRFDVEGMTRSYRDFYVGFGWMLSAYLFGHAIMFWQLGAMAGAVRSGLRWLVCVLFVEGLALLILSWAFLFLVPVVLNLAIVMLLGGAWWAMPERANAAA